VDSDGLSISFLLRAKARGPVQSMETRSAHEANLVQPMISMHASSLRLVAEIMSDNFQLCTVKSLKGRKEEGMSGLIPFPK